MSIIRRSDTDSFTDSAGNVSGERSSDAGSVNIGPKFSYSHFVDNGGPIVMIQPTLRISGSYKYKNQGDTRFASGVILTDDKLSASVSPGIVAQLRNGSSADIGFTRLGVRHRCQRMVADRRPKRAGRLAIPRLAAGRHDASQFRRHPRERHFGDAEIRNQKLLEFSPVVSAPFLAPQIQRLQGRRVGDRKQNRVLGI